MAFMLLCNINKSSCFGVYERQYSAPLVDDLRCCAAARPSVKWLASTCAPAGA
jgi:hypothetical protein